jgi:tetratricopeptide (TPR) repeat protein
LAPSSNRAVARKGTTILLAVVSLIGLSINAIAENPALQTTVDSRMRAYRYFIEAGLRSLNAGKLDDAYAEGEVASILEPKYFDAYEIQAQALLKGGYERDGDEMLVKLFAEFLPSAANIPGTLATLPAPKKASDSSIDKLISKGLTYLTKGKIDKAMQAAREAVAVDPSRFEGYALSSLASRYKGDLSGVADGLERSLRNAAEPKKDVINRLKVVLQLPLGKSGMARADWTSPEYVRKELPDYPKELMDDRIRGEVLVVFLVDKDGSVVSPFPIEATRKEFVAPSVQAVSRWKFTPATLNGRPIPLFMIQPIIFD